MTASWLDGAIALDLARALDANPAARAERVAGSRETTRLKASLLKSCPE